jgi:adenosylcobinamide kinase/adenosylcobinamide-phosphate guanylyltransferase
LKNNTFIIGGCRSGKSRYALALAEKIADDNRIFIATCIPQDDEMKKRVSRHQRERGKGWDAFEAPVELPEAILEQSKNAEVVLVDCLTLWISNLFMESEDPDVKTGRLTDAVHKAECPVIIVSNEVGTGIVPKNALARKYRDAVGLANQKVASKVKEVIWMVAGIPVKIKG